MGTTNAAQNWYSNLHIQAKAATRIDVHRRNKAVKDLTDLSEALRRLNASLTRLSVDVAEEAPRSPLWCGGLDVDTVAWRALRAALERAGADGKEKRLKDVVDVAALMDQATELRAAVEDALTSFPSPSGGRPKQLEHQLDVVRILALLYQETTGKVPTASASGPFAELVSIVIGRQKVGDLIRDALGPSPDLTGIGSCRSLR
jgi:hypothetical protein